MTGKGRRLNRRGADGYDSFSFGVTNSNIEETLNPTTYALLYKPESYLRIAEPMDEDKGRRRHGQGEDIHGCHGSLNRQRWVLIKAFGRSMVSASCTNYAWMASVT